MVLINENFLKLPGSYLFTETARRAVSWQMQHPGERLIRLGIGDVSLPIPAVAAEAMQGAAAELATADGFRGYGPECGYDFLRSAIARKHYQVCGISPDEVFISDGSKSDCGAILDIFDRGCVVGVCDPVYPAYVEALAISGRVGNYDEVSGRWSDLVYLPCYESSGFAPMPPEKRVDLVYLCFPNNPTGAVASKELLREWVEWANDTGAVILFDGAYEAFITDETIPHSIYEIVGARKCAVEIRSFSKMAGFTGVRCAYVVIPNDLERDGNRLNLLWRRRQAARSNGVSYVVQRGAEAVCTDEGSRQVQMCINQYRRNAGLITEKLRRIGLTVYGGVNAPYIWVKTPDGMGSWDFFDLLLNQCGIMTTPGVGFGSCGEGFVRLTAFGRISDTVEAMDRMERILH